MKKYIHEIFPRLLKLNKTLDNLAILVDQPWLFSTEDSSERKIFIFSANKELIVSTNGVVEKGKWEYYAHAKSIVIELGDKMNLFNQTFIDDKILLLKQDGSDELMIFGNGNKLNDPRKIDKYIKQVYEPKLIIEQKPGPKMILEPQKKKTDEEIAEEKRKREKDKLTERVFDLKKDIRALKIVIWMLSVLFVASLFAGIRVYPFFIISGIFGLVILLFISFIKSNKRLLKEKEKELYELNDGNN
jgi:hypothetical protein